MALDNYNAETKLQTPKYRGGDDRLIKPSDPKFSPPQPV